jgi:hypothetical protein
MAGMQVKSYVEECSSVGPRVSLTGNTSEALTGLDMENLVTAAFITDSMSVDVT